MKKTYRPPKEVAEEAATGLAMWEFHGKKCATPVGVKRARQLSKREKISYSTVLRMWKFFNRHFKNRKNGPPRCGRISWLLWGGNPGVRWVIKVLEKEGYFEE